MSVVASNTAEFNDLVAAVIRRTGSATRNQTDAAKLLGVSVDHFHRYIAPTIPHIRSGRLQLFQVRDLLRWLEARSTGGAEGLPSS